MVRQRYMIFTLIFVMFFSPIRVCYGDGVIPEGEDPGDPGQAPVPAVRISNVNGQFQPMPYQVTVGNANGFYHLRVFKVGVVTPKSFSSGTLNAQGNQAGLFPLPSPVPTWGANSSYKAEWYDFFNPLIIHATSNQISF